MSAMSNLFLLTETFTNGLSYDLLNLISAGAILCGILVIVSKNPIVSVLFLIGLFLNIASYLLMLGVNFIGLSYLLVYVGAVSILFLFILMLINVRISELVTDSSNSIPLALMIGIIFNVVLYELLPSNVTRGGSLYAYVATSSTVEGESEGVWDWLVGAINSAVEGVSEEGWGWLLNTINSTVDTLSEQGWLPGSSDVSFVTSHIWDGALAESSHITTIGSVIYTTYPIWLILTSVILLLAMVGAIVITIKQ